MEAQADLPALDGALVVGPVFISIELPGVPGHKARHRSRMVFPKVGKPFIHNYPDPETEAYEKALRQLAKILMRGRPPTERPLQVIVQAIKPVPKSWSIKERNAALAGRELPTGRPDGDNFLKVVCDALNQVCYIDDSQIVDARIIKRYGGSPAMRVEIREFVSP